MEKSRETKRRFCRKSHAEEFANFSLQTEPEVKSGENPFLPLLEISSEPRLRCECWGTRKRLLCSCCLFSVTFFIIIFFKFYTSTPKSNSEQPFLGPTTAMITGHTTNNDFRKINQAQQIVRDQGNLG